jgi:glutamine amidotransferase
VEECGGKALVSDNPQDIEEADHIILPGVGAFPDAMYNLQTLKWIEPLREAVFNNMPLLGICLGMQLLASCSNEEGDTEGLNFIPGKVQRLVPKDERERVPHVGWNEIYRENSNLPVKLLENIPDGTDFYFVHSYHFMPESPSDILTKTNYCSGFVSIVGKKNIFGTQFHPEKSGRMGFQLLKNFLNMYESDI